MESSIICRFCAVKKRDTVTLDRVLDPIMFNEIKETLNLLNFHSISLTDDDNLPKTVCGACYETLMETRSFLIKVRDAQVKLTALMTEKDTIKPEILELEVKVEKEDLVSGIFEFDALDNSDVLDKRKYGGQGDEPVEILNNNSSWSVYPWHCALCSSMYPDIDSLRQHVISAHGTCSAYKCVDCSEMFENFQRFINHVKEHRPYLRLSCHRCHRTFETPEVISKHLNLEHRSFAECFKCGVGFADMQSLTDHNYLTADYWGECESQRKRLRRDKPLLVIEDGDKSWLGYKYMCSYGCLCEYDNANGLRAHAKSVHGKCFAFKCADCEASFADYSSFADHVIKHRPYLKQYCQYCNYKFDTDNVSDHITSHFTSPQYTCASCGETFTDQDSYTSHKKLYSAGKPKRIPFKKRDRPISVKDLTCDICQKVARSLSNLICHKKIHTERQRNHTCDRCGKAYYTKDTLTAHAIVHNNPAPQVCKICDKTFLTIGRLRKHVSSHYTDKPFQCDHCKRGFRLKDQLKNHMIVHSDVMPYKCGYCEKRFRHRHVMRTHENQHTNARPYACTVCTMDFNNWSNCNKHMKRKHGKTLAKSMLTSKGKLRINPATGEPMQVTDLNSVSDWTEKILAPVKRGKKRKV